MNEGMDAAEPHRYGEVVAYHKGSDPRLEKHYEELQENTKRVVSLGLEGPYAMVADDGVGYAYIVHFAVELGLDDDGNVVGANLPPLAVPQDMLQKFCTAYLKAVDQMESMNRGEIPPPEHMSQWVDPNTGLPIEVEGAARHLPLFRDMTWDDDNGGDQDGG